MGILIFWVYLTFDWYGNAIVFCLFVFFFCLEATLGKDTFTTESDFNHCYGNFSKKPFGKLLDHKYVKFFFQQLQGTFTTACWKTRHPTVEDLTDMDQDTCWFFQQETKINEGALKIINCKKCNPIFQRTLHRNRWYFTCYYTFLFLLNKPSF